MSAYRGPLTVGNPFNFNWAALLLLSDRYYWWVVSFAVYVSCGIPHDSETTMFPR